MTHRQDDSVAPPRGADILPFPGRRPAPTPTPPAPEADDGDDDGPSAA
ncbi:MULTISPECIES: hypothetical protein [unclassified Brevundimonas]|nr:MULTISPECIES: hypothetical protein [unclassified Brevundimonas]